MSNATKFDVQGMTCPSCIRHVTSALNEVQGVGKVEVSLRDGTVTVQHDASASVDGMIDALRESGYEAKTLSTGAV